MIKSARELPGGGCESALELSAGMGGGGGKWGLGSLRRNGGGGNPDEVGDSGRIGERTSESCRLMLKTCASARWKEASEERSPPQAPTSIRLSRRFLLPRDFFSLRQITDLPSSITSGNNRLLFPRASFISGLIKRLIYVWRRCCFLLSTVWFPSAILALILP